MNPLVRDGRKFLGVDMGGSATRACVIHENESTTTTWVAPGGNVALDVEDAVRILLDLVNEASPTSICIGLAGARTAAPGAIAWLTSELRQCSSRLTVMSDAELALNAALGPEADGIVICAGTGSVAVVRKDGACHVLGGHGFLLGDEGSAYDIGKRLIAAALRDHDRGGRDLVRQVEDVLGQSMDTFVRSIYATPVNRQLLAELGSKASSMDSRVANAILRDAGQELVTLANMARVRFGPLPVRMMGGVFQNESVAQALRSECGAQFSTTSPELAAATLAARLVA